MQSPDCYASSFPISSFLDSMKLNPHFRTSLCPYQPPLVILQTPNQPPHPIFLIIFRYFGALESGCVLTNPTCYPPNPEPTRHPISSHRAAIKDRFLIPRIARLFSSSSEYSAFCNTHHNVRCLLFALRISTLKSVSNLLEMSFGISKTKYCSPVSLLIVSSP